MPSPVTFNTAARRASESEYPEQWNGLVGAWPLIEGGGATAFDFSGNGCSGSLVGGASWTIGSRGTELLFNGGTGYLNVPNASKPDLGTGDFMFSAWIVAQTLGGIGRGIAAELNPGPGLPQWWFREQGGGTLRFLTSDASDMNYTTTNTLLSLNKQYFVAAVRRGTSVEIWIDGKLDSAATGTIQNVTNTQPLVIGRFIEYWHGRIDDPRLYAIAPSADQILALYLRGPKSFVVPRRRRSAFAIQLAAKKLLMRRRRMSV